LEQYLHEYIEAAGIGEEKSAPLFRTVYRRNGELTDRRIRQPDVWKMIQRRSAAAGIQNENRIAQPARHRHYCVPFK
jgi:integrase/recombinase XerD